MKSLTPAFTVIGSLVCLGLAQISTSMANDAEKPFGLDRRIPWTTSRLVGSPEPPPPYSVERTFTNVVWKAPLYIAPEPGTDRLLVVQQGGDNNVPSKIVRIVNDPQTSETETLFEVTRRLIYGLTFHPGYQTNGHLFVFSNGPWGNQDRSNRVSRFTVARQAPHHLDSASESVILEWKSAGHDGGDLAFGLDGMLYITSGDGTSDSDGWVSGQDISNLLATVLRIDIDHPEAGRNYSVPPDNPFIRTSGARPEIWAYGFRNPWRMSVDRETGRVWVGNNGQDLWETAQLVRRGENYGWSVYEGSHPFYLNRPRGPTPIVKPTIEHHHSEFRSLTGGVVYYGDKLPDLNGVYVYGDYSTGKIWGARHDGHRLTWHAELTDTSLQIVGFGVDQRAELLIVDVTGGIYRLVPTPQNSPPPKFPTRLSETGVFASVKDYQVQPGLISYSVNAPGWADGAHAERHLGLPGDSRITYKGSRGWDFPDGTVLVQTLSLAAEQSPGKSMQRVETRLLVRQQGEWAGYSYRWNSDQTDATLVPAKGEESTFSIQDSSKPNGFLQATWKFPGRAECMVCHSRAANYVLGLTELQMNKDHEYVGVRDNQLRAIEHIGLFTNSPSKPRQNPKNLVDPSDTTADLDARARSYLHVNCSPCHVEAGGGNAKMELEFTTRQERMHLFDARPQHDTFGIDNAMLVAPGDPQRSVVLQRISRRGLGQMPPLVTTTVDANAVQLFRDWIAQMKPARAFVRDWQMDDLLPLLEQAKAQRSFVSGQTAFREIGCAQCHRFAGDGGSVGPDLSNIGRRLNIRDVLESIISPSKTNSDLYAATEIETKDGEIVAGRIEHEDESTLLIRTSPLARENTVVRKDEVRRRSVSKTSNMPTGILNVLEQAQILDLLAYLIADGNPEDLVFQK